MDRSGHLLFYRAGGYHAVPFDLATLQVIGESFPVLADAQELDPSGDWPQPVATAPGGALSYLTGPDVPTSRLTWIDKNGDVHSACSRGAPLRQRQALRRRSARRRRKPGSRTALDSHRGSAARHRGSAADSRYELESGSDARWPSVVHEHAQGRLRRGPKDINGSGSETAILSGPDDTDPVAWTRDGRLVFQGSEPDGAYPLKLLEAGEPARSTPHRATR